MIQRNVRIGPNGTKVQDQDIHRRAISPFPIIHDKLYAYPLPCNGDEYVIHLGTNLSGGSCTNVSLSAAQYGPCPEP